jgi:signal transduction histidine kinase
VDRLDDEGQGYFHRISAAARRMGLLIDEIIDLARITRTPLQPQEVDLAAMAREVADELQKSAPARPMTWRLPETLKVRGDPSLLNTALTNLLANAWKFTGKRPDGNIEFGGTVIDGKPVYYVRDNGAGFDMAYKDKLFQAFQRLHSPAEFPGTGIGLATVQRVVLRHGGKIWAEAKVGQGATFYFTLA